MNEILRNSEIENTSLVKTGSDGWRNVKRNILIMIEGGKEKYLTKRIRPAFEKLRNSAVGSALENGLKVYLEAGVLGEEEFWNLLEGFWAVVWKVCIERWENGEECFKCLAVPTLFPIRQVELVEGEKKSASAEVFFVLPKKQSGRKSFNFDRRILEESLKLNLLVVQLKELVDEKNTLEAQKKIKFLDFVMNQNSDKIKKGEFDVEFNVNLTATIDQVKEYSVWIRV